MIQLQNNVPQVYINESRDFQLFCRLYDSIVNGVKFNIDTMTNIYDPMKVNDKIIELLCTSVGFKTKYDFDTRTLRYIVAGFPELLKNKGSINAVKTVITIMEKIDSIVDNNSTIEASPSENKVIVNLQKGFSSIDVFNELLKFALPAGCIIEIGYYHEEAGVTELAINTSTTHNEINAVNASRINGSYIGNAVIGSQYDDTEQ